MNRQSTTSTVKSSIIHQRFLIGSVIRVCVERKILMQIHLRILCTSTFFTVSFPLRQSNCQSIFFCRLLPFRSHHHIHIDITFAYTWSAMWNWWRCNGNGSSDDSSSSHEMKIEMNFHAFYDAIDPFKDKISFFAPNCCHIQFRRKRNSLLKYFRNFSLLFPVHFSARFTRMFTGLCVNVI